MLHVALVDPKRRDEAAALLEARLGSVSRSVEGGALAVACVSAAAASEAVAALVAAGIEPSDFSMGSPSLDEVFLALTGKA